MWPQRQLIDLLQIEHPPIRAPMADPGTVELAASECAAFAEQVERLGGAYITGEDVGTTVADIETMRRVTARRRDDQTLLVP